MKAVARIIRQVAGALGSTLWSFVVWTVWLALGLILVAQLYVALTSELTVPDFILRRFERRLADTGLRVTFDLVTFDPGGRILVHAPRVYLPEASEPILTARAGYFDIDPWLLAIGKVEVREIRLMGGSVAVPAMFSPSGQSEQMIGDVDALVVLGARQIAVRHVTARIGKLPISVHGAVTLGTPSGGAPSMDLAGIIRSHIRAFCHIADDGLHRLDALDAPALDIELERSSMRGAIVSADLSARGLALADPFPAQFGAMRLQLRLPWLDGAPTMSRVIVDVADAKLPNGIEIRRAAAVLRGRMRSGELGIDPEDVDVAVTSATMGDATVSDMVGNARAQSLARWDLDVLGLALGAPLNAAGTLDLQARTAAVHFSGDVAPRVVDLIGARTHVDVRRFFAFDSLHVDRASARFGPGWKFERLDANARLKGIQAHGVTIDDGAAQLELYPDRLYAPTAYVRVGENFARGSYEHHFATHEFRFLLDGRLRPLDISNWFHPWWGKFFERFAFPAAPAAASVDVRGAWRDGRRAAVFVVVDAAAPVIVGQPLKRVRTRLFVRPGFYDGLETHAVDVSEGVANGVFTLSTDVSSGQWRSFDIDARSTVEFAAAAKIAEGLGSTILAPFEAAQPPVVNLHGHFEGPAIETPHRQFNLEARTSGEFRFYKFPVEDAAFTLSWRDDDLTVDQVDGKFAGGAFKGRAKVWGAGADRRIGFDVSVTDASLGAAASAVQNFVADRKGQPHPPPGKFVQEKANVRIDAAASAEGAYGNALSFHGNGNAALRGAEIGAVPLFGPLSALLKFTELRFTTAQTTFKINGPKLEFTQVNLRGANSAVDAHGVYALDRRELDFRAKVFPFEESGNVFKTVVGAVLSPISNVLEVKLTGTLEKPDWAFVIGPTNLFRSLAPSESPTAPAEPPAEHPKSESPKLADPLKPHA